MSDLGYWSRVLIGVSIAGMVLATLSFLLRLLSRRLTNGRVPLDLGDGFLALGLLATYGLCICTILTAFNGAGQDIETLPEETQRRANFLFWMAQKFWAVAHIFIKLSIIVLLRQTLVTLPRMSIITWCLIVFTIAWGITAIIANTLQCLPVSYFWNARVNGHCIAGQTALFMTIGAFSLVEDVILSLTPVLIVWQLKMLPKQKIQLTALFSVGALVCVFSLLRLVYFNYYHTNNLTFTGSEESIWTVLELSFAITCSSVVLMRPLFKACPSPSCFRRRKSESSAPSTDFMHFFSDWPYGSAFSAMDACSEVRADASRVPTPEMQETTSQSQGSDGIWVQTRINRAVQDRESILASIGSERGSLSPSVPSSRRGSVRMLSMA